MVAGCDEKEYPRVLVFGRGFDSHGGGGITLSNLFRGWPRDRLAVVDYRARSGTSSAACAEYRLGALEQKWVWPLSCLPRRSGESGSVDHSALASDLVSDDSLGEGATPSARATASRAARAAFHMVVDWLGAQDVLQQPILSEPLTRWVADFSPDVLYCHFSTLGTIRLVRALHECSEARLAIHIMDDWPETVYARSLMGPVLRDVVDRELRELLSRAAVRMAISRAMADEYLSRYGCDFEVFHNCIDVSFWRQRHKTSWAVASPLRVVYCGRIGWDALASFVDVCEAVELMNQAGVATQFSIYPGGIDASSAKALARYAHTRMLPAVEDEQLPDVLTGADVLIIPSNFEGRGRRFARLSMPTKVPAYMACATPIVLYSPRTHATCAWAEQGKWALVVGDRSRERLALALSDLAASPAQREALGRRASEIADREFDGRQVRAAFRESLAGLPHQQSSASDDVWDLPDDIRHG